MRSSTTRPGLVLVLLCTAQYMLILDVAAVTVALPSIGRGLGFSPEDRQWVVTANLVAFAGFLLLGGRAADLLGRRRVLVAGLALFGAGSLAGALAPAPGALVAARAAQGLGAALAVPAALALLSAGFPDGPERRRAMGAIGLASAAGSTSGVLLGGVLTEVLGWEAVLLVNVPIAAAAAIAAPFVLAESRDAHAAPGFDVAGAMLVAVGLVAVVLGVTGIESNGPLAVRTVGLGLLGVALLTGFVIHERRSPAPLVDLAIFGSRELTVANLAAIAYNVGPFTFFFLGAIYLQDVLGHSALRTGLSMLAFTLVAALMSLTVVGRVLARARLRTILVCGMVVMAGAIATLALVSAQGSYETDVLPAALLLGLGIQFAFVAINVAALNGVDADLFGLASGLLNTSLQMGAAVGLAVVATLAAGPADPVAGLRLGALAGATILAIGAAAALLLPAGTGAPAPDARAGRDALSRPAAPRSARAGG